MVKKEKAFIVAPRSLFDIVACNDLAQLCISVKGFNPHDTSPGGLVLSQKQRPTSSDGMSTIGSRAKGSVAAFTASDVAFERDAGGFTALHIACAHGHLTMVESLIGEYHCDVNALSDSGKSPLFLAAENGHESVVAYLLEQPSIELKSVTADNESVFGVAAKKQHHSISVKLNDALRGGGYTADEMDPVEAALGGDIFFFVHQREKMNNERVSNPVSAQKRLNRIMFAQDPLKNSIVATLASQLSMSESHVTIARYVLHHGLCGDVNEANSLKNTALHNICLSTGEKEQGESLRLRVEFAKLLLAHGADARRLDGQGNTPIQRTENPVLKMFLLAAEKKAAFMDSYVRRNQVPGRERQEFAVACKALKRAYRAAERAAESALMDPSLVVLPGTSTQSSPKTSARGPAKKPVRLTVLRATNLPQRSAGGELDPFVVVRLNGDALLQTPVAPSTSNPAWPAGSSTVAFDAAVGTVVTLSIMDMEVEGAESPTIGASSLSITEALLGTGGDVVCPVEGVEGASVVISISIA